MNKLQFKRKNPTQDARDRVEKAVEHFPRFWRDRFLEKHPEYNNRKGLNLLRNVYGLRTADATLTELFEELAEEFKVTKPHLKQA